jgi:chemotaxis response regulator CheB
VNSRRVLILSELDLLAQGIRSLLESDPRIEIVGVTADESRVAEIIRDEHPDVILVDADRFRVTFGHARQTIAVDWIPTLIAMTQNENTVHVCHTEERLLEAPEDLIQVVRS